MTDPIVVALISNVQASTQITVFVVLYTPIIVSMVRMSRSGLDVLTEILPFLAA